MVSIHHWLFTAIMAGFELVPMLAFAGENGVAVGDTAPDFTLADQDGKPRSLSEFRGKKVVLYFYPKDDTPGCTKEACNFRDNIDLYEKHDIVVLGVSYDSPESHKKFAEKYHLPFILLADTTKAVAKQYGAYRGLTRFLFPKRMTFLIDETGTVIHIFEQVDVSNHAREVLQAFGIEDTLNAGQENAEQE